MRILLLLTSAILTFYTAQASSGLDNIRSAFPQAVNSSQATETLLQQMLNMKDPKQPITTGYLGALYTLKAKHNLNPVSRLYYLKKGLALLNDAIDEDKNNAELCMLRYSVESKVPGMLRSGEHLAQDKNTMMRYLQENRPHKKNAPLQEAIADVLLEQKNIPQPEKEILLKRKNQCKQL